MTGVTVKFDLKVNMKNQCSKIISVEAILIHTGDRKSDSVGAGWELGGLRHMHWSR
jgi:hypothetical protein